MNSLKFPRAAAYLDRLPHGLDSFPENVSKASLCRQFLDESDLTGIDLDGLPPAVAQLIRDPPLPTAWVPTPALMMVMLALMDHAGMTDDDAARWSHDCNMALLGGRMYRTLTALASPSLLARGASMRWGSFHRGTDLLCETGRQEFFLTLRYPPPIFTEVLLRSFGEAFRVLGELSNAKSVTLRRLTVTPGEARYHIVWT